MARAALEPLQGEAFEDLTAHEDMGKVSIVGAGMRSHPGVAAKVFAVLAKEGVNIDMISTSPIKISCVIERDRVERAVQALHGAFELSGPGHDLRGGAVQGQPDAVAGHRGLRTARGRRAQRERSRLCNTSCHTTPVMDDLICAP